MQESFTGKIPKSIPMRYHTAILENIYSEMRFLADGIIQLNNKYERMEVQIDQIFENLNTINNRVSALEMK